MAGIAAGGLSACGLAASESFSDDDVLKDKITSVRLDSRSGGITLRGQDGAGQVSLQRKVDYKGDKPGGKTYRVEDGVLVLGGCGKDCSVNYTVDLPAGLPVTGKTSSGRITLSRVGAVTVGTSSGAVNLDDVAGAVDVHTTNGRITGTGLKGDGIKARTSNGKINLTPAKAQDVRAKTSNGAITLTVPDGRYKVTAKTNNGSKDIGVSNDPNGQYQLDLTTSNGAITVKSA
ncbi:DUF4097 family beta strand repeat-containing protein [Streptomyces sp. NPDC046261]|uniref:DUF4097 family beta strand repeat-containing protein n=1 Tax=Streptomyces sp. NPDC046261 TaxID=3157200 RepID=UPI0034060438